MHTEINLRHACGHWERWRIPAAPLAAAVYVEAIRGTPCPACHARATALGQARDAFGEYARELLRPAS